MRVQLAPVDCTAGDEADATLTLHYTRGGADAVATAALPEAIDFIAALHQRECLEQGTQAAASIELGAFRPSPAGEPAQLDLVVSPRPAGEKLPDLRITGIRETNLLTFAAVDAGIHPLAVDQTGDVREPVTVPLPLLPARCDAHAVQEDKRGTVFRLMVTLDGADGSFDLAASPELRGRLLTWVAAWCGYGS